MIYRDYYCKKCDVLYKDFALKSKSSRPDCPQCGNVMEWVPSKLSFKDFKGSHNWEYNRKDSKRKKK